MHEQDRTTRRLPTLALLATCLLALTQCAPRPIGPADPAAPATAAPGATAAVGLPPSGELDRFVSRPDHRAAVVDIARQQHAKMSPACPELAFGTPTETSVFLPTRFDNPDQPAAGAWREQVTANGCGATRTYNVLSNVDASGVIRRGPLLPGSTIAGPMLQREAVTPAFRGTMRFNRECREGAVTDTRFLDFVGGKAGGPWIEVWSVLACGKAYEVPIQFDPAVDGIRILVRTNEVAPR